VVSVICQALSDGSDFDGVGNPSMIYARTEFYAGVSPVFKLGASDALVMLVCTPPGEDQYVVFST
jgi:hypothetical protein